MKDTRFQGYIFKNLFRGRRNTYALRMTAMIDVIFLLLIFFLVAAKWRPQESFLPFQLPTAQARGYSRIKPEPLEIYIFATQTGCQVQVGQHQSVQIKNQTIQADLTVLMERIRDCMVAQKRVATDPIEIICDSKVKWEHLAKIYNLFFGAGLTDITFAMTE